MAIIELNVPRARHHRLDKNQCCVAVTEAQNEAPETRRMQRSRSTGVLLRAPSHCTGMPASSDSPHPASALSSTTNHGGVFQNTRAANAARPRPKSAGDLMALVHTG